MKKIAFLLMATLLFGSIAVACGSDKTASGGYESYEMQEADKPAEVEQTQEAVVETEQVVEVATEQVEAQDEVPEVETPVNVPFYGIWVYASKDILDAEKWRAEMDGYGLPASIMVTSDWSNLNSEKWYVITAGIYNSEEEANAMLSSVQNYYPDAYVKYSGDYKGTGVARIDVIVADARNISVRNDMVKITGIVAGFGEEITLVIDQDTIFDASCDMTFFGNYEPGMSVVDWYRKNMEIRRTDETDMSVLGVFDIEVKDNHVNKFYGSYWWD